MKWHEAPHRYPTVTAFAIIFLMFLGVSFVVQRQGDRLQDNQDQIDIMFDDLQHNQDAIMILFNQVCDSRRDSAERTAALLKDILLIVDTEDELTERIHEAIASSEAGVICPQDTEGTP